MLSIYNQLRAVPKEAQKSFSNGRFSGTDINPMWRIKKLTEQFGPCGIGWYWSEPKFTETTQGTTTSVHCTVALHIKQDNEWSQPIYGVGGNTIASTNKDGKLIVSDEAYKMAYTDAQSNAAKQIGLGADIWFDKDQTKYTAQQPQPQPQPQPQAQPKPQAQPQPQAQPKPALSAELKKEIDDCQGMGDLQELWANHTELQTNKEFVSLITSKKKLLATAV
jgi:hypothetical protein